MRVPKVGPIIASVAGERVRGTDMRVLQVYRTDSGEWAGVMIANGEEIGRIARCASPEEVEVAAAETWCEIEHVLRPDRQIPRCAVDTRVRGPLYFADHIELDCADNDQMEAAAR